MLEHYQRHDKAGQRNVEMKDRAVLYSSKSNFSHALCSSMFHYYSPGGDTTAPSGLYAAKICELYEKIAPRMVTNLRNNCALQDREGLKSLPVRRLCFS